MKYKGAIGGAYTLADRKAQYDECINWYYEADEFGESLQPVGGYEDLTDFDVDGNARALYRTTRGLGTTNRNPLGDIIVVVGADVIWYNAVDDTYTTLGTISNILNTITIVDDGVGVVLADGEQMYRIDMDSLAFSAIVFNEIKPSKVAVLNFRTICIGETADGSGELSNRFYYSDIADNSTWGALSYFELADVRSPILSVSVSNNLLYLYASTQYQVWQTNSGNIAKPFVKRTTGTDDIGLYAKDSVCELAGSQYFVGSKDQSQAMIYRDGQKISTLALDKELAQYDVSYTSSFAITENGHSFIIFQIPELEKTYCFDVDNATWHRRTYRNNKGEISRWKPYFSVNYGGVIIMGSLDESKLYRYDTSLNTQSDGGEILRVRSFPNLVNESRVIQYDRLNIGCRVGEGFVNNPEAPQLMFKYSQDGGYTWSSRITLDIGARGDYAREVEVRRLSRSKQFTAEISISDNANTTIHSVSITNSVSGGRK